ncbi:Arginase/deacetylase [Amanita rubescens]|nr:Arginase/deacetylase [Amanita rubescens]
MSSDPASPERQAQVKTASGSDHSTPGYERRTGIFLQDACFLHRFIRSRITSGIVERPERLRAVMVGLSATIARLEDALLSGNGSSANKVNVTDGSSAGNPFASQSDFIEPKSDVGTEELEAAMGRITINQPTAQQLSISPAVPITIIQSQASLDLLKHPAVKYVHGDIDKDVYLENLVRWMRESSDKIANGESEIPKELSQGDLYLCPQSLDAVQGALGTVCEAVDRVMTSVGHTRKSQAESSPTLNIQRAFVAIRPPGHHCGEDTPSGFCFVNNVAVAAAHAHQKYGVQRIVIFDIDLHHGNGTQSIIWQINEETYRQTLEKEAGGIVSKTGPQIYYGSIHDILSFPCEDGKVELVQAASASIHKAHGQYIENIHLEPYSSEDQFWEVLYNHKYRRLLKKAEEFLADTGGPGNDVLVFISCGMDACEHEYESMSRHGRKVPVSFYHQFTRDACAFSDQFADGRIISVLEGGYSDRALISGTMAHISGLVTAHNHNMDDKVNRTWWDVDNLAKLEKATKQRKGPGGRKSLQSQEATEKWLQRTAEILSFVDTGAAIRPAESRRSSEPPSMTLRDRGKRGKDTTASPPRASQSTWGRNGGKQRSAKMPESVSLPAGNPRGNEGELNEQGQAKKLPRVILRLKPET